MHFCTPALLHPCTPGLLYSFTPAPLHPCTPAPIHFCTPALMHSCSPSQLHPCTPALLYSCSYALLHSFTPAPSHPRFPVCFAQNRFMNLSAYYFTSQRISNNPPCGPSLHVLHVQKLVCKIDGTGTSYLQGVRTITGNCQFQ